MIFNLSLNYNADRKPVSSSSNSGKFVRPFEDPPKSKGPAPAPRPKVVTFEPTLPIVDQYLPLYSSNYFPQENHFIYKDNVIIVFHLFCNILSNNIY